MEKDLWVTEVLRGVVGQASQEDITVIFKGGTSRSKAYRLIKCFSEDVDMLVVLPTGGLTSWRGTCAPTRSPLGWQPVRGLSKALPPGLPSPEASTCPSPDANMAIGWSANLEAVKPTGYPNGRSLGAPT